MRPLPLHPALLRRADHAVFAFSRPLAYLTVCLTACLTCSLADSSLRAEPPTRDALILHLDASQLARSDSTSATAVENASVGRWENLVDGVQDFLQPESASRPQRVQIGDDFVVRFDGIDDHLRSLTNASRSRELTVFVVLAPHKNSGDFSGFLAANAKDRRDYETGFNLDLGPLSSRQFDSLNAEGKGFGGAVDLLKESFEFGTLHSVCLRVSATEQRTTLWIDGKQQAERPYAPTELSLEELTIGARYYTNGPGPQKMRSAGKFDIAEVLVYSRPLDAQELSSLHVYLAERYKQLRERLPNELKLRGDQVVLEKAVAPPLVQMLVPGFEVTELPVELPNINNVRYRHDGTLVALGYNGDIHLLRDTDGDGLEDQTQPFWESKGSLRGPIGMLLTPENYVYGSGVFTPSKGKLSLIVDKDGDDRADEERIVATGWKEIPQNVDATGIAMDSEGWLYFGLGTADYSNAYQVDEQGVAGYDLTSDRGTVQRLSPDFQIRETVCTGIRFPIAFAFNEHGDLFCAEQEGATWLANGNPFDELLQIVPDRHYGFPPRHPRHNPTVIDEPSVFNYAPQHQSTCGMIFNVGVNGGPAFGPAMWHGAAIVCGESRGKLWATQLSHTPAGYVAQSQLIACLQMLTIDACVSPRGDLIVACHSGPPDWGTGPTGIGKLFRIRMVQPDVARPTLAWANSEREIQIAFDQPLDPETIRNNWQAIDSQHGEHVRAGDRFETLVPPYAVVQRQLLAPRHRLELFGVGLSPDRRNLYLQTSPMTRPAAYAIELPWLAKPADAGASNQTASDIATRTTTDQAARQAQLPAIDIDLQPHGLLASFQSDLSSSGENIALHPNSWQGWLPHLDWRVVSDFTRHSSQHMLLQQRLSAGGELRVQMRLDLSDVLRPKVQPGSTLDYEWPAEQVFLELQSSQPLNGSAGNQPIAVAQGSDGNYSAIITVPASSAAALEVELKLQIAAAQPPDWSLTMFTDEDATRRPIPLDRFHLPWLSEAGEAHSGPALSNADLPELAGGSWGRGRRVFHSEAASCFKCHAIHSPGPRIGPDLSNLVHRDYASVLRDIRNPSFAIHPDHVGHVVVTTSDQVLTGVLRTENGQQLLGDANGNSVVLLPGSIASSKPSEVSVMPQGLDEKLSPEQLRDLMTFLLTPPPHMPLDSPLTAPPVRTQAEVAAVLAGSVPLTSQLKPLSIVLVAGNKDHGPGEHDYPAWQTQWGQLMVAAPEVDVSAAWDFPSPEQLAAADVLVFFQKGAWNDQRQQSLDSYFSRGGGAVFIHWAVNGDDRVDDFSQRIGLASRGGSIGYRHGPLELAVHNTDHPIMRNIEPLQLYDESYWRLTGDPQNVTLFATSVEEGQSRPQMWAYERDRGRVFVSIPGHYSWTFDDPIFRAILLRGIAWTAREPIDRFNELIPLGARMTP